MSDFDIRSTSGEQFSIGGQITKPNFQGQAPPWPNYPSNAAGFTVTLYAKRRKQDTAVLVTRAGVLQNGGSWTVTLNKSDTVGFTKSEELLYEVWLVEPDGTETKISKGEWEIEKSVR